MKFQEQWSWTHQAGVWVSVVIKLFIFIHPHFSRTHAVCQSFGPWVWSLFGENVTYMGARMDLKTSSTLPYLSKELTSWVSLIWVLCKLSDIVTISLCKNNTIPRVPHHTTSNTYNNFVSHLMTKLDKMTSLLLLVICSEFTRR